VTAPLSKSTTVEQLQQEIAEATARKALLFEQIQRIQKTGS
jgi:hypothetical protein